MAPPGPSSPGGFDYSRLAWFQRIGGVGYAVSKVALLPPPPDRPGGGALIWINQYRFALSQEIRRLLPGESGALAAALLTGDRGGISKATMAAMRDSGLAHLLAISGLHIGLLTMTLFFVLRYLFAAIPFIALRYSIKKWAALLSLAGAFCYFMLAGMTVPTQRAFIMMALSLGAILLDRRAISLRLVAVAAAAILLWRPESLVSVSFQMSFAAVVVLVAAYEVAGPVFSSWRRQAGYPRRIALYIAAVSLTTLAASIATAPFALYHFHKVASFGLVANLLAVPVMAFWVMPLGLLALVLVPLGLGAAPLLAMGIGIDAVVYVAVTVAGWEGATHGVPAIPVLTLAGVAISGLWLCLWRGRLRLAGFAGLALALLPALLWRPPDALISGDGAAFAVAADDGVHIPKGVRVNRVLRDWLARWGDERLVRDADATAPILACDDLACLHRGGNGILISYVFDKGALLEDCASANVIIATMPVGRRCGARDGVIDRYDLWRKSAHALWFEDNRVVIKTVAGQRGVRPWSDGRRY
jgi:competence protein ComEC